MTDWHTDRLFAWVGDHGGDGLRPSSIAPGRGPGAFRGRRPGTDGAARPGCRLHAAPRMARPSETPTRMSGSGSSRRLFEPYHAALSELVGTQLERIGPLHHPRLSLVRDAAAAERGRPIRRPTRHLHRHGPISHPASPGDGPGAGLRGRGSPGAPGLPLRRVAGAPRPLPVGPAGRIGDGRGTTRSVLRRDHGRAVRRVRRGACGDRAGGARRGRHRRVVGMVTHPGRHPRCRRTGRRSTAAGSSDSRPRILPRPSGCWMRRSPRPCPATCSWTCSRRVSSPDPYLGTNELALRWIGQCDWTYESTFDWTPDEGKQLALVFEGLDTLASVWLDGRHLGDAASMHRTWRWDVTGRLTPGRHLLAVRFAAPVTAAERLAAASGPYPHSQRLSRAIQHVADHGLQLRLGLGPAAACRGYLATRLNRVQLGRPARRGPGTRRHGRTRPGHVSIVVHLDRVGDPVRPLRVVGHSRRSYQPRRPPGRRSPRHRSPWTCPDAQRWWPHSRGDQPRTPLRVELWDRDTLLDVWERPVGFRTVALDTRKDDIGSRFQLVVNGEPIWVRGANWIPDDCFPARVTRERYRTRDPPGQVGQHRPAPGVGRRRVRVGRLL